MVFIGYNDGNIETQLNKSNTEIVQSRLANQYKIYIDGKESAVLPAALEGNPVKCLPMGIRIHSAENEFATVDDIGLYRYVTMNDAVIEGKMAIGETLTASYQYINTADVSKSEAISWYASSDKDAEDWGEAIGTGATYTIKDADEGSYIKAVISVSATDGTSAPVSETASVTTREVISETPVMGTEAVITLAGFTAEDGTVTADGYETADNKIIVPVDTAITFTVTAAAGKQFKSAVIGDTTITTITNGKFTLSGLSADETLTVTFEDAVISDTPPAIIYVAENSRAVTEDGYPGFIAFATIGSGYGWTPGEYGMKLHSPGIVSYDLKSFGGNEGVFAIKVYGKAFEDYKGTAFSMIPYAYFTKNGETQAQRVESEGAEFVIPEN